MVMNEWKDFVFTFFFVIWSTDVQFLISLTQMNQCINILPSLPGISSILCSHKLKWQSHIRVNFEEKKETSIIVPHYFILLLHLQPGTSFKSNFVKAISVENAHLQTQNHAHSHQNVSFPK